MPTEENTTDRRYSNLRKRIIGVLKTYFECDSDGNPNAEYDECYSAQDAMDRIREIIGEF